VSRGSSHATFLRRNLNHVTNQNRRLGIPMARLTWTRAVNTSGLDQNGEESTGSSDQPTGNIESLGQVRPGTPVPDRDDDGTDDSFNDAFSQPRRFRLRVEPNPNPNSNSNDSSNQSDDTFRLENHFFWGNVVAFNELLGFGRMRHG